MNSESARDQSRFSSRGDRPARILIIDDDRVMSENLIEMLDFEGYRAICTHSGEDALAQIPVFQPDLIISDLRIPGMDGMEILAALRAMSETASIPFVFMTGQSTTGDTGLLQQADGYLQKPFRLADFMTLVQNFTRRP